MTDSGETEDLFKIVIPEPTDEDLAWAKKVDKKGFGWGKRALRLLVDEGHLWRMNYAFDNCRDNFDASDLNRGYFSSSFLGEMLVGRAVNGGHDDLAALLIQNGAIVNHEERARGALTSGDKTLYKTAKKWFETHGNIKPYIFATMTSKDEKQSDLLFQLIKDDEEQLYGTLTEAIKRGNLYYLNKVLHLGDLDLSVGDFTVFKMAQDSANVAILKAVEGKLKTDYPEFLKQNTKVVETILDGDAWMKISDQEILYQRGVEEQDITITSLFDFAAKEITRTQYFKSNPPAIQVRNFADLQQDQKILSEAFNQLLKQGGSPEPLAKTVKVAPPKLVKTSEKAKGGMS